MLHPTQVGAIDVTPYISIDVHISNDGNIVIGFDSAHRFTYRETLYDRIQRNKIISPGLRVTDYTLPRALEYRVKEIASYNINERSSILNQSIIEYYNNSNQAYKIKDIAKDSPVIHVENHFGMILPYVPQFLREVCTLDSLPYEVRNKVNNVIKQTPQRKMGQLLKIMDKILQYNHFLTFDKRNVRAANIGYEMKYVKQPNRLFGNGVSHHQVFHGLQRGGVFEKSKIDTTYFVDPALVQEERNIIQFIQTIDSTANKVGVKTNKPKKTMNLFQTLHEDFFQSNTLAFELKRLTEYFAGTVVVIVSSKNIDKAYHAVKKEFGGNMDINTQFIEYDAAFFQNPLNNSFKLYNFLLGVFVKSAIQPWVLKDTLHSDCFVGLDVSHINGKHTSGIVQIIGKDGKLIKQAMLSRSESGEKISNESMEEILSDCIHTYEKVYGMKPKHITFHRDGRCREDIKQLQTLANHLKITLDYIEIIKNNNRRIATYENNVWKTEQGISYIKEKMAYLCATNPRANIGMAKPLKIVQRTNELTIEQVVEDVYRLSYMHVHSLNKTRLPISTHYADLSSTFHNKNYVHPSTKHEKALPFV